MTHFERLSLGMGPHLPKPSFRWVPLHQIVSAEPVVPADSSRLAIANTAYFKL